MHLDASVWSDLIRCPSLAAIAVYINQIGTYQMSQKQNLWVGFDIALEIGQTICKNRRIVR